MKTKFYRLITILTTLFIVVMVSQCKKEELSSVSKLTSKNGGPYIGVANNNGILEFGTRLQAEAVYQQLEIDMISDTIPDTICLGDHPSLDNFETQLGFWSIRREFELEECNQLGQGVDPINIERSYILDPIMGSFVNVSGKVIIEDTAFYWVNDLLIYKTTKENISAFDQIDLGMSPAEVDVEVWTQSSYKKGACNPFFTYTIDVSSKTITVDYSNSSTASWSWSYKGLSGQDQNQNTVVIDYSALGYGIHDVRIDVFDDNGTPETEDDVSCHYTRNIDLTDCNAIINYTVASGNIVSFNGSKSTSSSSISYEWQFPGGIPATATGSMPPPIDYQDCNGDKIVYLTIKSATCPNGVQSEEKIKLQAAYCCDKNPKHEWMDEVYNGGSNKICWCFNMGPNLLYAQSLKADMKNYKKRNGKWKKERGDKLDIDFSGNSYYTDQAKCTCKNPSPLNESPSSDKKSFSLCVKDNLTGILASENNFHRIKINDPITIDYKVNGTIIKSINISPTGFACDN